MAAVVVSSIAALVAGCGLPALPDGIGRSRVTRDPAERDRDLSREPLESRSDMDYASLPTPARCRVHSASGALKVKAAEAPAVEADDTSAEATEALLNAKLHRSPAAAAAAATAGRPRRVKFDLSRSTVHEITPYAEVYGVHPRDFNFGRGLPAPAPCLVDPSSVQTICAASAAVGLVFEYDSDDEFDDEEAMLTGGLRLLNPGRFMTARSIPKHVWCLLCVAIFLLRVFGANALVELVSPPMSKFGQ